MERHFYSLDQAWILVFLHIKCQFTLGLGGKDVLNGIIGYENCVHDAWLAPSPHRLKLLRLKNKSMTISDVEKQLN